MPSCNPNLPYPFPLLSDILISAWLFTVPVSRTSQLAPLGRWIRGLLCLPWLSLNSVHSISDTTYIVNRQIEQTSYIVFMRIDYVHCLDFVLYYVQNGKGIGNLPFSDRLEETFYGVQQGQTRL